MQILILSGNTGGGHNSAALAIKDYFELEGSFCDIRDSLAFWGELQSDIISNGHVLLYKKTPKLFGFGYRFAENHPAKENYSSFLYKTFSKGAKNLYKLLLQKKYDAIICTHVFAGILATEVKRRYIPQLKIYFVATDYTCSPGTPEIDANAFFIPHKNLINEFESFNIPKNKIIPSGIPVRNSFYNKVEIESAKKQLGLPQNKHIVLLMCGSMGCGPIKELAQKISTLIPENSHLAIICGSNRTLKKELTESLTKPNTTIVGFTKRMALYMDCATVAITKPGGLSSTEALVKGLPLVLIDAVPGCETHNMEFLISGGYAKTGNTPLELASKVLSYITNDQQREDIKNLILSEFSHKAAKIIYEHISNV